MKHRTVFLLCIAAWAFSDTSAKSELVVVTVSNPGNSSFALTPTWFGFDNGSFDLFAPSTSASAALEALAEGGDVTGIQASFGAGVQGVVAAPGGFAGAPVIEPGESGSFTIDVNKSQDRFFNFASMVIPSNDSFIGSSTPIEIFDTNGNFLSGGNSHAVSIVGSQIWDAGTDVNNTMGAAFSAVGGSATDQNGVVAALAAGGLDNFLNTGTPIGTVTDLIAPSEVVASISISAVPEPSGFALLSAGVASLGFVRRRKIRRAA